MLIHRKNKLEKRLKKHGIKGTEIQYLPYLEFEEHEFFNPQDVGYRMMILYSISYLIDNINDRENLVLWLKREKVWDYVSREEKEFFEGRVKDEDTLAILSWRIEAAFTLAWSLNLIPELHPPTDELTQDQINQFMDSVPEIGSKLDVFISSLSFRDKTEIFDENIFNELVTAYLRDLFYYGNENESNIHTYVSFERHKVLNWVRRFADIEDWDETDTST